MDPIKRLKVARACGASSLHEWFPAAYGYDRFALIRTAAKLIQQHQLDAEVAEQKCKIHDQGLRFIKALATNATENIEELVLELLPDNGMGVV